MEDGGVQTDAAEGAIAAADRPDSLTDSQLKEKVGAMSGAALLLKGSIIPDVAEPEANRADDPDSCLQYTVNAVSGERQAPPKTEDGEDGGEEGDSSLAMVYVRIHTGPSVPFNPALKTGELEALTELAAAEAGAVQEEGSPRGSAPGDTAATTAATAMAEDAAGAVDTATADPAAADEGTVCSTGEVPPAAPVAASAEGPAQQAAEAWDHVYHDVLQKIYSCRVSGDETGGAQDPMQETKADAEVTQQQEPAQESMLEQQAAHMTAHAIVSVCIDSASSTLASALHTAAAPESPPAAAAPSSSEGPSTSPNAGTCTGASPAAAAAVQDSSVSGVRTPVVLPPDAADLPVQAVLDELETLLAKSDELRSSVQLRSSRNASGQHTSTHLSRRNSLSVLDRPLMAAVAAPSGGSSVLHSRHSTEWEEAARSSRRRSSSQPASARSRDGSSSSCRRTGDSTAGDGDLEDRFDRTMLDSTEVRDEIRQHLQMITGGHKQTSSQDPADRRDAATSVGGLTSTHRQPLPASNLGGVSDHEPAASDAAEDAAVGTSSGTAPHSDGAGETDGGDRAGSEPRRSSSSRYGGGPVTVTESSSSMEKLHALYARFLSDSHTPQRRSTADGVLEQQAGASSTGVGRQPRRTAGVPSTIGTAPVTAPMRSSMPYPLAAMAGVAPAEGAAGRRCHSVSPQKEPRRSHALSHNNLQEHQQHQQQHPPGYVHPHQLQHSLSLCSSCGGPMLQRDISAMSSRAASAAVLAAQGPAAAAVLAGGHSPVHAAASVADAAALGLRTVSDALPSTHISISNLLAEGLVASTAARLERQMSPQPEHSAPVVANSRGGPGSPPPPLDRLPAQHSRSLPRNGGGELSPRTSSGGRGRGRHSSASPVRGRGGSYTDRFASSPAHRTASATHVADSSRRALSSSPDKRSHRALGTAPAEASCSDITLSQEGVGVTSITFGQLLQESALQHAMGQLEQAGVDSILSGVGSSIGIGSSTNSRYAVLGPAAAADGVGVAEGSAGVQVLNTVPEHGIVTGAAGSQPVLRRTHSRTGSRHRLVLPSQLDTCIAAASDSLQPPVHCAEPLVTSEQQARRASLIHSSSLQHERHTLSRSSSAVDRRLTASSSMKSRTSTASSTSSRVWRPGGNRTDPKDDYRKLQTYESARLRALQRQGLLSPGCSSRNLLLHEAGGLSPPGSASPKSRRSTSHDLASPVSPGALTGPSIISGALKTTPHSPSPSPSPGGYGAASARRQALAAAAAGGAGAGSGAPSPRQRASPGRAPAAGQGRLKAAAAKPAGLRSVLEPAQTAVSLTGLVGGSSTSSLSAPQKCTSPRLRKQEQQQQSQPKQQDIWLALTGQPCPASLLPMLQHLQHSGGGAGAGAGTGAGSPRGRSPYGSMSAQSSPERLRTGGDRAQRALSRSYPSGGNSTTVQVEEAIRAAQAALLQKQQQVLQVRRALSAPRYGAAAGRGGHGLSQSPGSRLHREQDGVSTVAAAGLDSLPDSSFWDGSSAASSYTGVVAAGKEQSTPRDLAAAFDPASPDAGAPPAASLSACEQHHHQQQQGEDAAATAGAAGVPEGSKATPRHGSSSHDGVSGQTGSRPGSRQAGGLATVSAPLQHSAQAAVAVAEVQHHSKEAAVTSTNAAKGAPAESLYSLVTVTAAAPSSPRSPPPAPAVNPGSPRSSPADPSRSKQAYRSPVAYHSRHKSHSPKRRPISALEALLKVAPSEGSDGGCQQQHVRPSSAEPAFASQLASGGRTVSGPVLPQRRSSQHNPVLPATATAADISGTHGSSSKAGGVSGPRISSSNTAQHSSGGGSLGGSTYLAEPWSAPAGRNAAGLTGEQLLAQHRRMSAAEAAEAAAAAAEGDDEVAGCAEHVMPLDALVRAYTALNKKNKNTSERAAAVAMLLDRITEGASHGGEGSSSLRSIPHNLDTAGAAVSQQLAGEGSPEQQQLKLRSSPFPGIEGMRLDVLGRGLSLESPPGVGGGSGSVGGPSSPSTIIKTLKEDSLSAWQRVSPERQAAHATLLATPKHKHASSYAAGLAALAAGSSSTNLHAEKSVHRGVRGPESPGPVGTGSAGKQQPIPADSSSNSPGTSGEAQQPGTGSSNEHSPLHQAREGSVTGAGAARGCTALRHARVSSSTGSVAASDVSPSHPQEGSPLHTQPTLPPAVECPEPRPMVDTATGRLALGTIGAHEMTVAAALTWLKAGLQSSDAPAAAPPPSRPRHRRPGSPRRLGHSRPCSPFSCFGGKGDSRGMVRSSDEGGEGEAMPASPSAAAVKEQLNQQQQQQQQVPQQEAGVDGVTFEMGGDNRLVMVVRQPGGAATAPQKLAVTGMRLRPVRSSQPGARSAGGEGAAAAGSTVDIAMVESSSCALDLLTTGGAHTIELASESDWAGLVVGLNAMLLLLEQEGPEAVQHMGAVTMSQAAWSKAVTGVE